MVSIRGRGGLWLAAIAMGWGAAGAVPAQQAPAAAGSAAAVPAAGAVAPLAPIPFAPAHQTIVTTPSAANAWGGERTGKEPTLSDRVVSYAIDASLDAAKHQVAGKEHMTWRNRSDRPVSHVYFHLYLNAFENDGSTWFTERKVLTAHGRSRGNAVLKDGQWGWIHLQEVAQGGTALKWSYVHPDGGPATDHTVVRIDLAQPVPAGGTLALDINFLD